MADIPRMFGWRDGKKAVYLGALVTALSQKASVVSYGIEEN
jgi:hypothetical protein